MFLCTLECNGPYSAGLLFLLFLKADGKDNQPFRLTVRKLEEGLQRAKEEVTCEGMLVWNSNIYMLKERQNYSSKILSVDKHLGCFVLLRDFFFQFICKDCEGTV